MNQQARFADLISSLDSDSSKQDQVIRDVVSLAQEHGLNADNLDKLYEVLLGMKSFSVSTALCLSNAIIPLEPISSGSVLLVLSSLGEAAHSRSSTEGRVEYRLQKRLLQQFVVLCQVGAIEQAGTETLKRCYGVVEKGLDYKMLREPTAALLCQLVEKSHVSTARIERIDRLVRLVPNVPSSLIELSRRYHQLSNASESFHELAERGKPRLVDDSNEDLRDWSESLGRMLESRSERNDGERKTKRRKLSHKSDETVALEGLVRDLDHPLKKSIPTEMHAILDGKRLTATEDRIRLESWRTLLDRGYGQDTAYFEPLRSFTSDYYISLDEDEYTRVDDSIQAILTYLLSICEISGELPEAFEAFLADHLSRWDGLSRQAPTFALLSYLKPPEIDVLNSRFLQPLSTLSEKMEVDWLSRSIESLSAMMIRWAVRDWDLEVDSDTAFGRRKETLTSLGGLQAIVDSVDSMIQTAAHRFPNSIELRTSALDFYDKSLDLSLLHDLPVVVVPSPTFAYSALCSDEIMSLSRMGGILARLREALTGDKTAIKIDDPAYTQPVNAFNSRLLEYGNALWKKHFLASTSPDDEMASHGLSIEDLDFIRLYAEGRNQSVNAALGLTTHAAFSSLAVKFLKILAENQGKHIDGFSGKVTTSSLKQLNSSSNPSIFKISFINFRPLFLEYLRDQGAEGLFEFLYSSMQSLIKRRESQGG